MSDHRPATLNVGAVFDRVINTYFKTWKVLTGGALVVFGPIALLAGLAAAGGKPGVALLLVVVAAVAGFWYQGMVVETVRDVQDGTLDNSLGELLGSAGPSLGSLIAVGVIGGVGIGLGLIALVIPGLMLMTIWAVAAPAVVIERKNAFDAFGRSRELVKGNGWPVFGVLVAIFALNIVLAIIVAVLGSAGTGAAVIAQLAQYLVSAPVSALAAAIMYFALREAHGDSVLAQPTGVLSGGFVPPVVPSAAESAAGWPAPPAAPRESVPDAPASAALPVVPAAQAFEPPVIEVSEPPAAAPEPAETPVPAVADPPLAQPAVPAPAPDVPAERAFGEEPEPAERDPFGQPDPAAADEPSPLPDPPRESGQSIPPPGWKPPADA